MVKFNEPSAPLQQMRDILAEGRILGAQKSMPTRHVSMMRDEVESEYVHRYLAELMARKMLEEHVADRSTRGSEDMFADGTFTYRAEVAVMPADAYRALMDTVAYLIRQERLSATQVAEAA